MATPNKGTTFRAICRYYKYAKWFKGFNNRKNTMNKEKLFEKVSTALENIQIRHGELKKT